MHPLDLSHGILQQSSFLLVLREDRSNLLPLTLHISSSWFHSYLILLDRDRSLELHIYLHIKTNTQLWNISTMSCYSKSYHFTTIHTLNKLSLSATKTFYLWVHNTAKVFHWYLQLSIFFKPLVWLVQRFWHICQVGMCLHISWDQI